MRKLTKILTFTLLVVVMMTMFTTMVKAADDTVGQLFNTQASNTEGLVNVGGNIVSVITTIGIIVAVIVLLVLGIKYMMGSAAEKAEYKKTMIPYLVGAVLIFGASAIAKAVIAMTGSLTAC